MSLRPLGSRVLIEPDEKLTESIGGLVLPDNRDHVSHSGTVVAVGDGPKRDQAIRAATIERCLSRLKTRGDHCFTGYDMDNVERILREYKADVERPIEAQVRAGDRVAYSAETGLTFSEDGRQYLVMDEADLVVLVEEQECVA